MTVKEFAKRAEIHVKFAYAIIAAGKVPHHRIGGPGTRGTIRITEQDYERFLASTQVDTQAPDSRSVLAHSPRITRSLEKTSTNNNKDLRCAQILKFLLDK